MKVWIITNEAAHTEPVRGVYFTEEQATERAVALCREAIIAARRRDTRKTKGWRIRKGLLTVSAQHHQFDDASGKPMWEPLLCIDVDEHEVEGCAIDLLAKLGE